MTSSTATLTIQATSGRMKREERRVNPEETSWEFARSGQDEPHGGVGPESPMLPYLVGREVTAILEAAQAAAEQITERARQEAQATAERITAGAREQARVVQERIERFQMELAELLAERADGTEPQGQAWSSGSRAGSGTTSRAGTSEEDRIVVEYRREGEAPSTGEGHDGGGALGVEHDREAEPSTPESDESPAVQLLRQLVR